ncbi:unnamed protein product [Nesidiocoris tenuis]|uniref:Cytosol aminopeptidase domain-containing protein n=1 Tax=Nesidiocoris tenuis TaxID=355587 RepID=A0A6H5FV05_9HEMI|nr:unnamed protein product [Nesidiocoris tenuis]CAA9993147.1 unnamed protein product [Nesidiocoris tenuis]
MGDGAFRPYLHKKACPRTAGMRQMTPPAKDVFSRKADDCIRRKVMGDDRLMGEKGMELQRPASLKGLIPLFENMISGSAIHPGDVVLSMDDRTILVEDTDNEGRVAMADALVYSNRFNPSLVVSVATLTLYKWGCGSPWTNPFDVTNWLGGGWWHPNSASEKSATAAQLMPPPAAQPIPQHRLALPYTHNRPVTSERFVQPQPLHRLHTTGKLQQKQPTSRKSRQIKTSIL